MLPEVPTQYFNPNFHHQTLEDHKCMVVTMWLEIGAWWPPGNLQCYLTWWPSVLPHQVTFGALPGGLQCYLTWWPSVLPYLVAFSVTSPGGLQCYLTWWPSVLPHLVAFSVTSPGGLQCYLTWWPPSHQAPWAGPWDLVGKWWPPGNIYPGTGGMQNTGPRGSMTCMCAVHIARNSPQNGRERNL